MEGQKRLKAAKVLCIGTGGLGSPLCLYLAAAGVGTIGLVDFDVVDVSNLQRQIIHFTPDVGRPKVVSAAGEAPGAQPRPERRTSTSTRSTASNALELFAGYDVIVDGTDNFPTRYLVNDACVLAGQAERLRVDLPVRRPGVGVLPAARAVLPLPLPRAAAAGPRPELRRGGRAGDLAGVHRRRPGDRDGQADARHGPLLDRPAACSTTPST